MSDLWRQSLDLQGRPAQPVQWTCAAPPGDLLALRRWRAAVGPVRVGGAALGGAGRWPLTVAVWNANVGGGAIRALWDHLTAGEGAAGRPIVMLLQEVFATGPAIPASGPETASPSPAWAWAGRIAAAPPGGPRTDIVSFARETGLSLLYAPSMRNGAPAPRPSEGPPPGRQLRKVPAAHPSEDRGNAILANVPLSSPRAIELPLERQRRVAVAAEVVVADTRVGLCSVHLDNRAPWSRMWRTLGVARRRQMARLLNVLPRRGEARAQVLGGDLNTWIGGRREGAWRLARERFPHPAQPDSRPTHRFEIGGRLRHSDHLMFRLPPGWYGDYGRLDDTFGSDHYPLVGALAPAP